MWVGTRELLPSSWRWFSACVTSDPADDPALTYLAQMLLVRVQRALEARDAAWRALHRPQDNDTVSEVATNIDFVLMSLMGAFDVSARVAHGVLQPDLTGNVRGAGWQRDGWFARVATIAPTLAASIAAGTPARHALDVVRVLRNTVHAAGLPLLSVSKPQDRDRATLLRLPSIEAQTLVDSMDALGGRAAWGVEQLLPGQFHVDPGQLIENVFRVVLPALDELMRLTPVERLPGATTLDTGPPEDEVFAEHTRLSIRWQLGFPRPGD